MIIDRFTHGFSDRLMRMTGVKKEHAFCGFH